MKDDKTFENQDNPEIDLLDMGLFLNRLDGNRALAVKLIDLFLKYFAEKQADIKQAIDDKNPKALNISAHSFKGMLLHFCKQGADLVYQLEKMGNSGEIDMAKAKGIYDNLNIIVDKIVPELEEYKLKFKGE